MSYRENSKLEELRKYFWPWTRQQNVSLERSQTANYERPRSLTGYLYCAVCDSRMDTEFMWGNHMKGNRHFNNSKKFKLSKEEPSIQNELDTETTPIVGLDHIYEILCSNNLIVYQCLLCFTGLKTSETLINHITGLEHRMAFLKEYMKENYSLVNSSELTKSEMEPVVQTIISKYERKYGRGKMFVMKAKKTPGYYISTYKKNYDSDDEKWFHKKSLDNFSPENSPRCSPRKFTRMEEKNSKSEYKKSPVYDGSRERKYKAKPYYSEAKVSNIKEPKSTFHNREPADLDIQDVKLERDSYFNPAWPSRYEGGNWRDLRMYLEQKKNNGTTAAAIKSNVGVTTALPSSSEIKNDSDALVRLVHEIPPELFLRLALFKLDKMHVKEGKELKLLDRVIDKGSALALKVKKKVVAKKLKAKYKDTLNLNSTSSQDRDMMDTSSDGNSQFAQNLDKFIGHYKARKTNVSENICCQESYSSDSKLSDQIKPMSLDKLNDVSAI